ncbi:SMI1/KNR4 family protein [Herbaspirillum rubrisubalbicans]|uniref:SMI1/KNR4 family protein n=1 Tax=Herbaspirillum rubrisubalbicans TaxID=80842 RepID=UPI000DD414D6|nr:SMI1/KNR4 family protein [Herbaspirillum rubrisubalbicans]
MSAISIKLKDIAYRPFKEVNDSDSKTLTKLSEVVGYPVPSDYLEFLKEFPNTGIFDADIVCSGIECAPCAADGLYPISLLYASCSDARYDLLNFRKVSWELPAHFLVIGDDIGGNYFCLDLRMESLGKVYFLFHEEGVEAGLYFLANDFSSFINSLRRQ